MLYENEWLIHKFNIAKQYFEKIVKNNRAQVFHKFVYDKILYPDQNKLLPVFFDNGARYRRHLLDEYQKNFKFS